VSDFAAQYSRALHVTFAPKVISLSCLAYRSDGNSVKLFSIASQYFLVEFDH
jgi:hypothetical protein